MNTLILQQRQTNKRLESSIKRARRSLFELDIAQAKWEIAHGKGKVYASADALMRDITKKLRQK